jgi:hypothetical protein
MSTWEYQITVHQFPQIQCEEEKIVECDQVGGCFLHVACQGRVAWLETIFGEKGKEGWELVQSGYHNKELFCIWKKPSETGEKG